MTATTHRTLLRVVTLVLVALIAALVASVAWPARVAAADKGATTLTMQPVKEGTPGTLLLAAKLTDAAGEPIAGASVDFIFMVDFMGQTQALLGTATTTSSGAASFVYRIRQNGPVDLAARFRGDDAYTASLAAPIHIDVNGIPAPAEPPASRVRIVGQWVPWAALALAVAVWLTLVGVVVRTVVVIPSASRGLLPEPTGGDGEATQDWRFVSGRGTS